MKTIVNSDGENREVPAPDHRGHRERLKERFIRAGESSLSDHELLELLLMYAVPRKDMKPAAKRLLQTFGSVGGVMSASPEMLMQIKGVGKNSAVLIQLASAVAARCCREEINRDTVFADKAALHRYLRILIGENSREKLFILFLDKKERMIGEWCGEGDRESVKLECAGLLQKIALHPHAASVVIAHNHPSEICAPSRSDVETTFFIKTMLAAFGIELKDHLIVTPAKIHSILKCC